MRRLLASASFLSLLVPARAVASPPEHPPPQSAAPRLEPVQVGPAPPRGDRMVKAGMFFTVFGSLTFATSSLVMNHMAWGGGESWDFGWLGLSPLVASGGLVTLGGLLLHFGQERRWAYADWQAGRPPIDRAAAPRPGSGLLLAGPLTLAGSATIASWGFAELGRLHVQCDPSSDLDWSFCWEGNERSAALLLSTSGAGLILGVTMIVLGANHRARYLDWRLKHARPIKLRPTPWTSVHGFGLGLQGQF